MKFNVLIKQIFEVCRKKISIQKDNRGQNKPDYMDTREKGIPPKKGKGSKFNRKKRIDPDD